MSDLSELPSRRILRLSEKCLTLQRNDFVNKSLSSWAVNQFMGCGHGCSFCYVPEVSVVKQKSLLRGYGVESPAEEWGRYTLVRPWDRTSFLSDVLKAEGTPLTELNRDGNRAVMYSSTTDPYQVLKGLSGEDLKMMRAVADNARRKSLEMIRDHSTLNVRILTRSPLAREDFELMRSFGDRLMFGVSLPTLDEKVSRIYEPDAPGPQQRLQLLEDAHAAGIATFVAVAPVFPQSNCEDLVTLFKKVEKAQPHTIFMEPVNIRLKVAERIEASAKKLGMENDVSPFRDSQVWADYAVKMLKVAELAAEEAGVRAKLHLWPDKALGSKAVVQRQSNVHDYTSWLQRCWERISEWPGKSN